MPVLVVDRLELVEVAEQQGAARTVRRAGPRSASNSAPRLAIPVSRSVCARRCSCSSRRRSSVTSRPTQPMRVGPPVVVREDGVAHGHPAPLRRRRSASRPPADGRCRWPWPARRRPGPGRRARGRRRRPRTTAPCSSSAARPVNRCRAGLASRIRPSPSMMQTSASVASTKSRSSSSSSRPPPTRAVSARTPGQPPRGLRRAGRALLHVRCRDDTVTGRPHTRSRQSARLVAPQMSAARPDEAASVTAAYGSARLPASVG